MKHRNFYLKFDSDLKVYRFSLEYLKECCEDIIYLIPENFFIDVFSLSFESNSEVREWADRERICLFMNGSLIDSFSDCKHYEEIRKERMEYLKKENEKERLFYFQFVTDKTKEYESGNFARFFNLELWRKVVRPEFHSRKENCFSWSMSEGEKKKILEVSKIFYF